MPVSREMYEKAVSAVKGGKAPDDVMGGLMDIIDEYESSKPQPGPAKVSAPASPANFGEGGSIIGGIHEGQPTPTGGDLLDQRITQPEMHAEAERKGQELDRARKEYPRLGAVLGVASGDEVRRLRADEEFKKNYDESLPTASKRRDLARPPEFIPKPAYDGATNPLDIARANLPAFVGGKVEHYLEPPLSQFRRDMALKLGDRVMNLDESSREYHEYSDKLWQPIYDQAQADGRPVVRVAYKEAKTPAEQLGKFAMQEGGGALMGLAAGFDDVTFGVPSRLAGAITGGDLRENLNRLGETSPTARIGGQVAGSMLAASPGNLAARGTTALIPEAAGIGGAAMRAGLGGAAAGATTSASMNVANREDIDPHAAAVSALLGFPMAAVGGAVGQGLKGARANLRADKPALATMEEAGMGETSFLKGIKRSDYADQISDEYGAGKEVAGLSKRMEEPLTAAARRLEKGTEKELGGIKKGYFQATESDEKPVSNFLNDTIELRKGLTTPDGRPIPRKADQLKYLDKLIGETSDVEIVPTAGGRALVRSSRPGTVEMTLEEAERAGINVQQAMRGYQASHGQPITADLGPDVQTSIPADTDVIVRVTPRSLNPGALEKMKGQLDLEMGFGENPNKQELAPLLRSAREARDVYPAKGPIPEGLRATVDTGTEQIQLKDFSAFQRQAAEKTGRVQRVLGHAGLEKNVPEALPAGTAEGVQGRVAGYGKGGRSPDVDDALRELAALGKEVGYSRAPEGLKDVEGMRSLLELEKGIGGTGLRSGVGLLGGAGLSAGEDALQGRDVDLKRAAAAGLLGGALGRGGNRLRLDALSGGFIPGALAGTSGSIGGIAGRPKKALPKQFDAATLERLQLLFGPPGGPL